MEWKNWRADARARIDAACATREGKAAYREAMKRHLWLANLGFEHSMMQEMPEWERLPYALVAHVDGFVMLDRKYRLWDRGERYLNDWRPGDGVVRFVRDPRLVPGLFTLVVGKTGWLYNSPSDSSADYKQRLDQLLALQHGLGRC